MLPLSHLHHQRVGRADGFSLVEIMVALVIGMLGIIVMMQVFAIFEGQKRTTTGGSDAQNSGALALFDLQRELQKSGYGISAYNGTNASLLSCNVLLRAGVTLNSIAPVTINHASIPAGDANTDTLLIVYGNGNGSGEGDAFRGANIGTIYPITTSSSFAVNDRVIARLRLAACNPAYLTTVTAIDLGNENVTVTGNVDPAAMALNDTLYNLGSQPNIRAYAIRNGNLTVCDYMTNDCSIAANTANTAIWTPIANDIVSLQAIYGHDAVTPTPAGQTSYIVSVADKTTPTTACGWARTPAIGIALVVRSGQYEKTAVTTAAPTWGQGIGGPFAIDLTRNPDGTTNANWGNYRYKIFQTVAPLRNIAWQGVQTGC